MIPRQKLREGGESVSPLPKVFAPGSASFLLSFAVRPEGKLDQAIRFSTAPVTLEL